MNRIILSRMVLLEICKEEMAAAMGMSLDTLYRRLHKPESFTIGELKKAAKKLRMKLSDLIEAA